MVELIKTYQLDIMLLICGACGILIFLLVFTRFLPKNRKRILILMEMMAFFLLWFDRFSYIYDGDTTSKGLLMLRLSNFMLFFLTSGVVFGFNLYLMDWLKTDGKVKALSKRLTVTGILSAMGMLLAVVSAFSKLYYYFDEQNVYHRGAGFLIAYIIPVVCPIMQYTVIRKHRAIFSRLIYISLVLYIFVPIAFGIIQIFTYGISPVNIAMVAVSICLYLFTYLDMNNTVEHAHEIEIQNMQGENKRIQRQFDRTTIAIVSEIEEKDGLNKGNSLLTAEYAKRIARNIGKDDEYCNKVHYVAMFNSVGLAGVSGEILDFDENEAEEMKRIADVASDYVYMTSSGKDHDAMPDYMAREELIKGSGDKYDPVFADAMIKIIDSNTNDNNLYSLENDSEKKLSCGEYRENIAKGIEINNRIKRIKFECICCTDGSADFSAPSIILFDSFDRRVHSDEKTIFEYHYLEYGEIWFNQHQITTAARKMETVKFLKKDGVNSENSQESVEHYEITASRFEDHIKLVMSSPEFTKEVVIALPEKTVSSYIGLTGEHCEIQNISIKSSDFETVAEDIPRIVSEVSYINHMESDIKNVQIDRPRSASTEGIALDNRLKITFHSMTLPMASLIWHCPYIVLYSSKDGAVGGADYREYDLIKLNGENNGSNDFAQSKFKMKKKDNFSGWDAWKKLNKEGVEYEIALEKKGNRIILKAENLGISIESTTTIFGDLNNVYVALTGDQVALTDIRIRRG